MQSLPIPIVKGDRESDFDYRDNLNVNYVGVPKQIKGDQGFIVAHDGLTEFATTSGTARGGVYNERFNKHFRVSGQSLECVHSDGEVVAVGVIPGVGICKFANSFNTQAILSDGRLFLYDNSTITEVVSPNISNAIDITWFRGIYVLTDGESLHHTNILDEFTIDPLAYSSSEFAADPIKAVVSIEQNQIIAFNRYSTEFFYFNENAPVGVSVLQSIQGKSVRIGTVGTYCKTELSGIFFILGGRENEENSIYALSGASATPVASREVTQIIAKYSDAELADTYIESRIKDDIAYLIVHLPNETLLYNHTVAKKYGIEAAWSYVKTGVEVDSVWRAKFGVYDPNAAKWIYGDLLENKLAYLDSTTASQYGEDVEQIFYTPIVPLQGVSINEIELDTITGHTSENVSCFISASTNGTTYTQEACQALSRPYEYSDRFIIRQLGYMRRYFNFKFRIVSGTKTAFSKLRALYD
jgi:hypothetical protein